MPICSTAHLSKNQFRRKLPGRCPSGNPTEKLARAVLWLCLKGEGERARKILAALSRFRGPRATVAVLRAAERLERERDYGA